MKRLFLCLSLIFSSHISLATEQDSKPEQTVYENEDSEQVKLKKLELEQGKRASLDASLIVSNKKHEEGNRYTLYCALVTVASAAGFITASAYRAKENPLILATGFIFVISALGTASKWMIQHQDHKAVTLEHIHAISKLGTTSEVKTINS